MIVLARRPVVRLQALALRRPAGQFDSGMGYCLGCLAAPSAGSTKPGWQVRLLHDLLVRNYALWKRGSPKCADMNETRLAMDRSVVFLAEQLIGIRSGVISPG